MKKITFLNLILALIAMKSFGQCGTAPTSISLTPVTGANCGVILSQVGGVLPPGGNYYWYQYGCGNGLMGTGPSIFRSGAGLDAYTYYVRIEAPCGNSACASISGTIPQGNPPATITANGPTSFCSPGSVSLSANTGLYYQWRLNSGDITGATNQTYVATTSNYIYCRVSYLNGCRVSDSNGISVEATNQPSGYIWTSGPTTFCSGGITTLWVHNNTQTFNDTYQWKRNGVNLGLPSIVDFSDVTQPGNYSCQIINQCGTYLTNTITITVIPTAATITAAGSTILCGPSPVTLNANTGSGYTWQWRLNSATISGATNSSYNATATGIYDCMVTNSCGTFTSNTISVTANLPSAYIWTSASLNICPGQSAILNVNPGTGWSYQWQLNGSSISGATNVSYGATVAGSYVCVVSNSCGSTLSNNIIINPGSAPTANIFFSGNISYLCSGGTQTINANTGTGISYQWRLNGIAISGAVNSSYTAAVTGSYDCIETNGCGSSTSYTLILTASAPPPASVNLSGPATFCTGGSVTLGAYPNPGHTYVWKKNGSAIPGATASTYVATSSGIYNCTVSNLCGESTNIVNVTVTVLSIPTAIITTNGPTTFCQGGSVLLNANTGTGLTYQWNKNALPISGATTSGYSATATGSYTVVISNICGTATSSTVNVTVTGAAPAQPGTITGPSSFCSNQSGVVYSIASVASATSYIWIVPNGAVITAGQGTTSITVTFGNKNGNIKVAAINACGTSAYRSKNVSKACREAGEPIAEDLDVKVFPNPTSSQFILKMNLETGQRLDYFLYDEVGRLLEQKENLQSGSYEFGSSLPGGIYYMKIITGEEVKMMKLVKQE